MPALISLDQMARWQMRLAFLPGSYRAFAFGEEIPLMLTPDGHPYLSLVKLPRISRSPRGTSVASEEQEPSSSDERNGVSGAHELGLMRTNHRFDRHLRLLLLRAVVRR